MAPITIYKNTPFEIEHLKFFGEGHYLLLQRIEEGPLPTPHACVPRFDRLYGTQPPPAVLEQFEHCPWCGLWRGVLTEHVALGLSGGGALRPIIHSLIRNESNVFESNRIVFFFCRIAHHYSAAAGASCYGEPGSMRQHPAATPSPSPNPLIADGRPGGPLRRLGLTDDWTGRYGGPLNPNVRAVQLTPDRH